jgi:hypothetical protein
MKYKIKLHPDGRTIEDYLRTKQKLAGKHFLSHSFQGEPLVYEILKEPNARGITCVKRVTAPAEIEDSYSVTLTNSRDPEVILEPMQKGRDNKEGTLVQRIA